MNPRPDLDTRKTDDIVVKLNPINENEVELVLQNIPMQNRDE